MPARRLEGAPVAAAIRSDLVPRVEAFTRSEGRPPSLSIVLVGDDPASHVYVGLKQKAGGETGLRVDVHRLSRDTSLPDLVALVGSLNRDGACDGILVQSPLPKAMGPGAMQQVFDSLDPAKDVDCVHPRNVGLLAQGRPLFAPCTPAGIIELLERNDVAIAGRHAVVVGRSEIVGKPMAMLLLHRDATVTICHSRTRDLGSVTRQADVLISAVGRPGFLTPDMVKPGAAVVDVGTTPLADRPRLVEIFGADSPRLSTFDKRGSLVVGDVHPSVEAVAGALSPVPGGVGPLTIVMLLKNTLTAAEKKITT